MRGTFLTKVWKEKRGGYSTGIMYCWHWCYESDVLYILREFQMDGCWDRVRD